MRCRPVFKKSSWYPPKTVAEWLRIREQHAAATGCSFTFSLAWNEEILEEIELMGTTFSDKYTALYTTTNQYNPFRTNKPFMDVVTFNKK